MCCFCVLWLMLFFRCNLSWNWSVLGEEDNFNHFSELPYQTLTNYDIGNNFISGKRKFANLMNNDDFQTIIKQNNYSISQ